MSAVVLLAIRLGLLVMLWLFVLFVLRALRKDTVGITAGSAAGGAPMAPLPPARTGGQVRMLQIVDGPATGSHMDISARPEVTIGRDQNSVDFVVSDDYASSRHARLIHRGSDWYVEDLDSRNGTFVGGQRLEQVEKVGAGTDIRIGRTTVRLVP